MNITTSEKVYLKMILQGDVDRAIDHIDATKGDTDDDLRNIWKGRRNKTLAIMHKLGLS